MKKKKSKLDPHTEELERWFDEGKTLDQAREELQGRYSLSVSPGLLSQWWEKRQQARMQDRILERIATGAQAVKRVEKQFAKDPPPELETLIKLHRVLIMQLTLQANADPELLKVATGAMRPVLDFVKEQGKTEDRTLARDKFQRETAELFLKWHADQRAREVADSGQSNSQKIEKLGELMFGQLWQLKPSKKAA